MRTLRQVPRGHLSGSVGTLAHISNGSLAMLAKMEEPQSGAERFRTQSYRNALILERRGLRQRYLQGLVLVARESQRSSTYRKGWCHALASLRTLDALYMLEAIPEDARRMLHALRELDAAHALRYHPRNTRLESALRRRDRIQGQTIASAGHANSNDGCKASNLDAGIADHARGQRIASA